MTVRIRLLSQQHINAEAGTIAEPQHKVLSAFDVCRLFSV